MVIIIFSILKGRVYAHCFYEVVLLSLMNFCALGSYSKYLIMNFSNSSTSFTIAAYSGIINNSLPIFLCLFAFSALSTSISCLFIISSSNPVYISPLIVKHPKNVSVTVMRSSSV